MWWWMVRRHPIERASTFNMGSFFKTRVRKRHLVCTILNFAFYSSALIFTELYTALKWVSECEWVWVSMSEVWIEKLTFIQHKQIIFCSAGKSGHIFERTSSDLTSHLIPSHIQPCRHQHATPRARQVRAFEFIMLASQQKMIKIFQTFFIFSTDKQF